MMRWGDAGKVVLADRDPSIARSSAQRLNQMLKARVAEAVQVDASDKAALMRVLAGADVCLSAVPYYFNPTITEAALEAAVNLCDLGGNTDIARRQHASAARAKAVGISLIPNCGQVPGMGTSLCVYAMELLDEPTDVYMWDGGIPRHPRPPFQYLLTFHVAGLTNEYAEPAVFLREGKVTIVEPMTELEIVDFPEPIGRLEAFVAGGGTDTMPWTFEGRLRTLQNLTLRWPGHFSQLRAYWDLGLWNTMPIQVGDQQIVPRDVFHALFEPKVSSPGEEDMVIVRVKALGNKGGRPAQAIVEVIDFFDRQTGFSAMERGTGWSAAIVAEMMARGETPRGAGGVESMVPAKPFVEALRKRGIGVREEVTTL
jgi:lysine 6-dehydrogenase